MIRNITTNFIENKKITQNVLNSSSNNERSTVNTNDLNELDYSPLNQQQVRQIQGDNYDLPLRLDSSQKKMQKLLNLVNKEQGMLLDNCTQGQYTRRKKGNTNNLMNSNLQACYNPEIPTNNYSLRDSFSSKIYSLSPLNNRSFSLKKHSVSQHQNTDNLESPNTNRSSLISKNNTISYQEPSFSQLNTLNINNFKKIRSHNRSINPIISPKNAQSNNSLSSLPMSARQQQMNTKQLQIYPGSTSITENQLLGYNPKIEMSIPFERNRQNNSSSSSSTITYQQTVLKDASEETEFLENQYAQYPLVMPQGKIIILDYINNQPGIAVSEIKFKMENHWLKFFSRSARAITDLELLLRVQPYAKKIIKQLYGQQSKREQNYEKGMLRDCSKWQILQEIQSYERGDLSQTSFDDFITHYFLSGSFSQRKQILETLIESIRKEVQYYYPRQVIEIDSLLDTEGHFVDDIFQIDILNPILIVGRQKQINALYNTFKQQIVTLAGDEKQQKYSIYSLRNPRRQAQQTFDVPEFSMQNAPSLMVGNNSSENSSNILRLPQILFNSLDVDRKQRFRLNNNSKDSDNLDKYNVMLNKQQQQQDYSSKNSLSADERFKFIENKLNFKYAFSLNFKSKVRKKNVKMSSISDAKSIKISPKKQKVNNSSFVESTEGNYDDFSQIGLSEFSLGAEDLKKIQHEFFMLASLDQQEGEDDYSEMLPSLKQSKKPVVCLLTTFLLMDPCFAAKNQKTQKKFLKALGINENIDDLWSSMLSWPQFLKLKAFTSRNIKIPQKIEFLSKYFNPHNLLTIEKKQFMELLKDSRGITPSTKARQLSYDIFADDIWKRLTDLSFAINQNILIKEFLEASNNNQPAVMLVLDAIFEWMFPIPFYE